jgi:hypothetical protein
MPQNPPEGYPRVMPYLLYEDSDAALEFLVTAFGFTEKMRLTGDDGRINHAEVSIGDGDHVRHAEATIKSQGARRKDQNVYVYVDTSMPTMSTRNRPARRSRGSPRTSSTATGTTSCTTRRDTSGTSERTSATCPRTKWSQPG